MHCAGVPHATKTPRRGRFQRCQLLTPKIYLSQRANHPHHDATTLRSHRRQWHTSSPRSGWRAQRHIPRVVKILHPDYGADENTLLDLFALEDGGGLDYDTTLAACGILAGNIWTGFLAVRGGGGQQPGGGGDGGDGVLRGRGDYFFQLPDADAPERPYPVVARFQDWLFPHGNLPPLWRELDRWEDDAGASCRLTDSDWSVERARLVPLSAGAWWFRSRLAVRKIGSEGCGAPDCSSATQRDERGVHGDCSGDQVGVSIQQKLDTGQGTPRWRSTQPGLLFVDLKGSQRWMLEPDSRIVHAKLTSLSEASVSEQPSVEGFWDAECCV